MGERLQRLAVKAGQVAIGRNPLVAAVGAFEVAVESDSENVCRTKGRQGDSAAVRQDLRCVSWVSGHKPPR